MIFSVFTILACVVSIVRCSRYVRLEERVNLMERKQFQDSTEFREDIKTLFNEVNNIANDANAVVHVGSVEQELTKDHVVKLDETIKAVRRYVTEEKHHSRNIFDAVKSKLWKQEEHCNTTLMSMKAGLDDGFNRLTTNDLQVTSRIDYTVSLLEKLSDRQEQTQSENEHILEQMKTFNEIIGKVFMSLSHIDGQIETLKQETMCGTWKRFKTSCYFVGNDALSFVEASSKCETLNAHLAEIESEDENRFLTEIAKVETIDVADYGTWVGGTDIDNVGVWTWYKSKTPFTFTAWKKGEPNGGARENCLHLFRHHQWLWNDYVCTKKMSYICEKEL